MATLATVLSAQPTNDDCATVIDLGEVPNCDGAVFTNVDATTTDIGDNNNPSCFNGGTTQRDVFFSFTLDPDVSQISITLQGVGDGPNSQPLTNPQYTIYRGSCDMLSEVFCTSSAEGSTTISATIPPALFPDNTYYLRINDYSSNATPNWGDFSICIEEFVAPLVMGTDFQTNRCTGTVFDSGGPTADYGNDENNTLVICPAQEHECIVFDIANFSIIDDSDALNIYAGDNTGAPLIATLDGVSNGEDFRVFVNSECATLQFTSDEFTTSSGFALDWSCSAVACSSSTESPIEISGLPFSQNLSTCDQGATFNSIACGDLDFMNGPETIFIYDAPGGSCANISLINAEQGTGIAVLDGPPTDPNTNCVRVSQTSNLSGVDFREEGRYYIVVANGQGCTDFGIRMEDGPCTNATSLVEALCNPLNNCVAAEDLTSTLRFQDDVQDIIVDNASGNGGCWLGIGAESDFFWFTIEAQATGPFGFLLESGNVPSDIDFNVWGPFSPEEVCDTPDDVVNTISTSQPIRSSWAPSNTGTGLTDVHPILGTPVTDDFDCGSPDTPGAGGDDYVRTIAAQEGEVYVVLVNDFGDNIINGNLQIDWTPSTPAVLAPREIVILAGDTSVCAFQPVQIQIQTDIDNINWIGDNTADLSCTDCFDPIATPSVTTTYQAVLNSECNSDTVEVQVQVFDLEVGPGVTVCQGATFEVPAGPDFDNAIYSWSPPAELNFSCIDCPTPTVTTSVTGTFNVPVTLTNAGCSFNDVFTVIVEQGSSPTYTIAEDMMICRGEIRAIGGDFTAGHVYTWTSEPNDPDFNPNLPNPAVSPDATTTYFLEVTNGECPITVRDSVTLTVLDAPTVDIIQENMMICRGDTIALANTVFEENTTYQWTGPNFIFDADRPGTFVVPATSGNYRLTAERDGCQSIDQIMVEVTRVNFDFNQPDTALLCFGDTLLLQNQVEPADATVQWSVAGLTGNNPVLRPTETTTYIGLVEENGCLWSDTLVVRVDSLPADLSITADIEKDPYCQGELITLTSPIYDPFDYPDIEFMWDGVGLETSDTLYNMVFTTTDTFNYFRITTNGACVSRDTIPINVLRIDLSVDPTNPLICPGESVQLTLNTNVELDEIVWMPGDGLSCTDCLDPMASPTSSISYTIEGTKAECTAQTTASVLLVPPPTLAVIGDQLACPGSTFTLNTQTAQEGVTYEWTSTDPTFSSNDVAPTVTVNETTTFSVTATNSCDETAMGQVTIAIVTQPAYTLPDELTICVENEFSPEISFADPTFVQDINWQYDGSIDANNPANFIGVVGAGNPIVTFAYGTPTELCGVVQDSFPVNVVDQEFMVNIVTEPSPLDTVFGNTNFDLTGVVDPAGAFNYTYSWVGEGVQAPDMAMTSVLAPDVPMGGSVNLAYDLFVTTDEGCSGNASIIVTVIPLEYEVPDFFSPNNDNVNDIFKPYFLFEADMVEVYVYNRWGQIVYESSDPLDFTWDGQVNDNPAPADVYMWRVVVGVAEETIEKTGQVTLVR